MPLQLVGASPGREVTQCDLWTDDELWLIAPSLYRTDLPILMGGGIIRLSLEPVFRICLVLYIKPLAFLIDLAKPIR
jgi:hypothetical protein